MKIIAIDKVKPTYPNPATQIFTLKYQLTDYIKSVQFYKMCFFKKEIPDFSQEKISLVEIIIFNRLLIIEK